MKSSEEEFYRLCVCILFCEVVFKVLRAIL